MVVHTVCRAPWCTTNSNKRTDYCLCFAAREESKRGTENTQATAPTLTGVVALRGWYRSSLPTDLSTRKTHPVTHLSVQLRALVFLVCYANVNVWFSGVQQYLKCTAAVRLRAEMPFPRNSGTRRNILGLSQHRRPVAVLGTLEVVLFVNNGGVSDDVTFSVQRIF